MKKADIHNIQSKIYTIRDTRVMLDFDLTELYGVETKVLNQAVKRNIARFPNDFMFQLNKEDFQDLISQTVTSSWGVNLGFRYRVDLNGFRYPFVELFSL